MPIVGEPFAFEMRHVKAAPEAPGVYAFFVGRQLVFFGLAQESLRADLAEQYIAQAAVLSEESVSGFVVEVLAAPQEAEDRYRELIFEFNTVNGHMPERNGRRSGAVGRNAARQDSPRPVPDAARLAGAEVRAQVRPRWSDHA